MPSNYNKYRNGLLPDFESEDLGFPHEEPSLDYFEDYDNSISDIDFSNLAGKDFNRAFKQANKKVASKAIEKRALKRKPIKGVGKKPIQKIPRPQAVRSVGRKKPLPPQARRPKERLSRKIGVKSGAKINRAEKKISRILVPADKKVIVEGVNKFILSQKPNDNAVKNIGYYKGKKLKELVLIFNNTTPNPFTIELFNPSAPLDYLYNTAQNLNNKIEVAGNQVAYSDVLFNLLANPTIIPNCKFTFSGINVQQQRSIPLKVIDREITGEEFIQPLNLDLTIDNMQVSSDIVFFDVMKMLNRPFIPDGMDTIEYTVLPNMSVVMAFFFEQKSLKKAFYKVARDHNQQK
jgi:hypothetical protein